MGLWSIRSVPVMVCTPGVTARKAVMNLIAVPAAFMSITSGMSFSAFTMTSVSSQSDRFSGIGPPPASACMMSALLLMLFDAGSVIVALSFSGG